jgi:hypothetical protein
MIWVAKLQDGSIIKQHDGIKLDKDKVTSFKITESSGDSTVNFSADSGIIRFTNLNYQKITELSGGEEVKLIFDKENEVFRFDTDSLEFINDIVLRDEKTYFFVEFNETGKFNVAGQEFYMSFRKDKEYSFMDNPPYNNFNYTIGAYDDFYMGNGAPLKKTSYKSKFFLEYEKDYSFDIGNFNIKHTIVVDILKSIVLHESYVTCDRDVNGSMVTYFGDTKEVTPIEFHKNSRKYFKKTLTLL